MGSRTDGLLIDNPLALAERLFGPERQFDGHWMQFHEHAAPLYIDEAALPDPTEDESDALDAERELCPQEE